MMTLVERITHTPRIAQAPDVEPHADAQKRARKRAEAALADRARGQRATAMRPPRDLVDEVGWLAVAQSLGVPVARAVALACGAQPSDAEGWAIARVLDAGE